MRSNGVIQEKEEGKKQTFLYSLEQYRYDSKPPFHVCVNKTLFICQAHMVTKAKA